MNELAQNYINIYDTERTRFIDISAKISALEDESETIRATVEEQAMTDSATSTGVASLKRKLLAKHNRYQEICTELKTLAIVKMYAEKEARIAEMNAWNNIEKIH